MRKLIFCLVLGLLIGVNIETLSAQGSVRGKVTDKETGEPIISANVFLKQTGQGTITDLDGNYVLRDIPEGVYDIECTYLGYGKQRILGVRIVDDGIKLAYFRLSEAEEDIGVDVVVTAEAAKNLEISMMATRKNSAKILETLSSEQIFRNGDENVGDALKHLTNISVENDNNVYIRGLGSRYVKTLLNGAEVPGLDLNTSSVQLDLFPSSILDNIIVYKNFSPDQIGSFGGGYVEINTKSFPEKFTMEIQAAVGAHSIATFNNSFTSYEGRALDFLGVDDGTRALPSADIPAPDTTLRSIVGYLNALSNNVPANFSTISKMAVPNTRFSFMISNQTNFKKGKSLSYGFVMLYKNSYKMYEDGFTGLYELTGNYNSAFVLTPRLELSDKRYQQDVRNNLLFSLAYKSRLSKVSINIMNNLGTEKTYRVQNGSAPVFGVVGSDRRYRTMSWLFDQKQVIGTQLAGKHLYNNVKNTFEWQLSTTRSQVGQPDLRYFAMTYDIDPASQEENNFIVKGAEVRQPTRFYRGIVAWNGDGHLDFTYDKPDSEVLKRIKWGLRGTAKYHIFDERQIRYQTDFFPFTGGDVNDYIQPENYIRWNDATQSAIPGLYVENAYDARNNYIGLEAVVAGYMLIDLKLMKRMKLTTGLRTEATANAFTYFNTTGVELDSFTFYPVILPAVSLKYEVQRDMFIRAGYTSSIARPTLREISTFTNFDYFGDYTVTGNYRLASNPTTLHNFDFRWEVYPSNKEVVAVGAFFKYLNKPIEIASMQNAPNEEFQFQNIPFAYLFGAEIELKQGLGILGDWGKNFVMGANLGVIYSQARITNNELALMRVDNPEVSNFRQLFGQSPYVMNFLLNYNNDNLGLDVNASFHISGKKIVYVLYGNTPNIYEQPRGMLNVNIAKHLKDRYHFRFSVENLLDAKLVQIQTFKGRTYSYRQNSLGRTIWLGFSYLIK